MSQRSAPRSLLSFSLTRLPLPLSCRVYTFEPGGIVAGRDRLSSKGVSRKPWQLCTAPVSPDAAERQFAQMRGAKVPSCHNLGDCLPPRPRSPAPQFRPHPYSLSLIDDAGAHEPPAEVREASRGSSRSHRLRHAKMSSDDFESVQLHSRGGSYGVKG